MEIIFKLKNNRLTLNTKRRKGQNNFVFKTEINFFNDNFFKTTKNVSVIFNLTTSMSFVLLPPFFSDVEIILPFGLSTKEKTFLYIVIIYLR